MVFSLTALLVAAADQLTKTWVRANLALGEAIPPAGFFQITHTRNTGAVFGLFPGQSFLLTMAALVAVVLLLLFALVLHRHFPMMNQVPWRLTLSLMLGGTMGNLIDRLRLGYVTDFISIGIWPAFNIADSAVTVGTLVFAYFLLRWALAGKS